ncbi:cytochrome c3 family protein [Oryzomonas japonica]|uniref:Cytochrome c3 family protein n=1 Tax=Oryzomonas japonica TaxID=2603858 RepID=A0A7J4ZRS3_9BACT|nr:cytochrome c3 family protein [Oryzomonas japonica]KAB0665796.1 cytochrome c3 family protein [Oryzomonas japonica]
MVNYRLLSFALAVCPLWAVSVHADEARSKSQTQVRIGKKVVYPASRGDVVFDHDMHVDELKGESCAPCHRKDGPMGKDTLARFDTRIAHYFCKGCHRERGRGPTECHGCHKVPTK